MNSVVTEDAGRQGDSVARREESQMRILGAARALFAQRGFSATTTRAIAQAAGCNLSMINYYFSSKEGLLEAILREFSETVAGSIEQVEKSPELTRNFFEILVDLLVDFVMANKDLYIVVIRDVMLVPGHPMQVVVQRLMESNVRRLSVLIEKRICDGRSVLPPSSVLRLIPAFLMGMIVPAAVLQPLYSIMLGESDFSLRENLKQAVTHVLSQGILNQAVADGVAS